MFHNHLDHFKDYLLKVGLTQNRETMTFWNLTTIAFFLCEHPTWIAIHWHNIWLNVWSHGTSHYNWGLVTTLHDFGSFLRWSMNTSFGLSQIHGHSSWLVCEVALMLTNSFPVCMQFTSTTVLVIFPCRPHSPNFSWMPFHFLSRDHLGILFIYFHL
jgi:hypothetical protein